MSKFRPRLTYANVAATLALVFSMSGGAMAATHYLISKKSQIKPSVLKQLKGNTGATGAAGPQGPQGPAGGTGPAGSAVAYASVVLNGLGNPGFLVNSGFAAVTEPQTDIFCLTPTFAGHAPVASPVGEEAIVWEVSPQQCPGGYEFETTNLGSGDGFNVTIP